MIEIELLTIEIKSQLKYSKAILGHLTLGFKPNSACTSTQATSPTTYEEIQVLVCITVRIRNGETQSCCK